MLQPLGAAPLSPPSTHDDALDAEPLRRQEMLSPHQHIDRDFRRCTRARRFHKYVASSSLHAMPMDEKLLFLRGSATPSDWLFA